MGSVMVRPVDGKSDVVTFDIIVVCSIVVVCLCEIRAHRDSSIRSLSHKIAQCSVPFGPFVCRPGRYTDKLGPCISIMIEEPRAAYPRADISAVALSSSVKSVRFLSVFADYVIVRKK